MDPHLVQAGGGSLGSHPDLLPRRCVLLGMTSLASLTSQPLGTTCCIAFRVCMCEVSFVIMQNKARRGLFIAGGLSQMLTSKHIFATSFKLQGPKDKSRPYVSA